VIVPKTEPTSFAWSVTGTASAWPATTVTGISVESWPKALTSSVQLPG
jgi:hypothetical protein